MVGLASKIIVRPGFLGPEPLLLALRCGVACSSSIRPIPEPKDEGH